MAHARALNRSTSTPRPLGATRGKCSATIVVLACVIGGGGIGCHGSSLRSEALVPGAPGVATPATGSPRPDDLMATASRFESDLSRQVAVATPVAVHPSASPVSNEGLFAEVPVACEGSYEVDVSFGLGLAFPGNQDLKFKRSNAAGALIDNLFTRDVTENVPLIETLSVDVWRTRGFLADFGLRLTGAHWKTRVKANSFEDQLPGGGTSPVPPFDTLDEDRLAVYVSLEKRFWLARDGAPAEASPYAYLGVGVGYAYADVTHGEAQWGSSLEGYAGFSVPVADRLRVRIEGLLLVAHDVDLTRSYTDWRAETSGIRTSLPNAKNFAHLDTWFLAMTIGVEYRL